MEKDFKTECDRLDVDHAKNKEAAKKKLKEDREELRMKKENGTFPEYANMLASLF